MAPRSSTNIPFRSFPSLALTLILAAGTAASAHAQDALGTGRALDRNLQVGSGGINRPVNNLASDIAFRNAIVTGNVTGGFGFRGEVGYTGAFDFRDSLGSDDIFSFQARSTSAADVLNFHSGPAMGSQVPGMRGLDATQRSLGWGVASQSPALGGGRIIDRQFAGTSVGQIDQAIRDPLGGAAGITVDEFTRLQGAIRSTSDLIARSGSDVNRLGIMEDQQRGTRSLRVGSDLLAVRDLSISRRDSIDGIPLAPRPEMLSTWRDPAAGLFPETPATEDDPFAPARLPGFEQRDPRDLLDPRREPAEGTDPLSNRLPTNRLIPEASPYRTAIDSLRIRNDRISGLPIDGRTGQRTQPMPDPAAPADPAPDRAWALTLDQRLEALRAALQEDDQPFTDPTQRMQPDFDQLTEDSEQAFRIETLRAELRDLTPEERQERLQDPEFIEAMTNPRVAAQIARETLAGSGVVVRSLITRPETEHDASLFERHMKRGQELLAEGGFFAAEERFTAALYIVPGDPLAAAGRIHAQIGAGMYRSATLNLRSLLRNYPELAAVRFDAALLPAGDRLETTLGRLRERTMPAVPVSQEAGLLLAYLGHQFDNQSDIRRGINAARKVAEETDRPLDPLVEIVAAIWLTDDAPSAETPPAED